MKKWIGFLFVIVGLGLVSYPIVMEMQQKKELAALEKAISIISANGKIEEELSPEQIDKLPIKREEIASVMELEIPSIRMKQYILPETTEANLDVSLTQIKKEQQPGKGNFTVAGHRGYRDGRHFSNLSEVQLGEKVLLHDRGKTYVYEVTSSKVIPPTAVEVLEDQAGINEITMITCTVSGKNRVAVKGKLLEVR